MDKELIEAWLMAIERDKALKIAEQYKMNNDRIKNLCALFDDTHLSGGAIAYHNPDRPIGDRYITLINAYLNYVNPILYTL